MRGVFRTSGSEPFFRKHAVDDMVDVVIIEPLRLAQNPFRSESKSLGNCSAFQVSNGTADFNPVQVIYNVNVMPRPNGLVRLAYLFV